jgi:hypothetical protein
MFTRQAQLRGAASVILGLVLSVQSLIAIGQAVPAAPSGNQPPKEPPPTPYITTAEDCFICHSHPKDYEEAQVICRMNESLTWKGIDKHAKAFESFLTENSRAQDIGKRLGIDVTKHRPCLACHSVIDWQKDTPNAPAGKDPIPMPGFDRRLNGVSCVACHGAFSEWTLQHQQYRRPAWRNLSRQEKQGLKGMLDLWNPVTRAAKCVSCHVGKSSEDKVITHQMYAAGHPPLPGIEVFTFSNAMPRHWEYLGEKLNRIKNKKPEVRKAIERNFNRGRLEKTELVAASGLVLLREWLDRFTAQTDARAGANLPWPDYANFDCSACHHDLATPGWRQSRGKSGPVGRPLAPIWPSALVELGVVAANPAQAATRLKEFDQKLHKLEEAISVRPFGDKDQSAAAATALICWAEPIVAELTNARIDCAAALGLLDRILQVAQSKKPDYDAARQLYWAYRAIYEELEPKVDPKAPIPALLAAIDVEFAFGLPSAGQQELIENTLARRLKASASFDPDKFLARFLKLPRAGAAQ